MFGNVNSWILMYALALFTQFNSQIVLSAEGQFFLFKTASFLNSFSLMPAAAIVSIIKPSLDVPVLRSWDFQN